MSFDILAAAVFHHGHAESWSPPPAPPLAHPIVNPDRLARLRAEGREARPTREIAGLLDRIDSFLARFVSFGSEHQRHAVALWVAHTHAFAAADCSPRLAIQSAEKASGKTRLLEVLELVTRDPRQVVNMSEAALFRSIAAGPPTILFDEVDAIFGPKSRDREDLRAMLNAGYRRGATVDRCVGEGAKLEVKAFPVFCPVALAGIGRLPDTVQDRSIVVRLSRRRADEPVEKLRRRLIEPEAAELRRDLGEVFGRVVDVLADAYPEMGPELPDRAADVWECLVSIGDLAGGDWPVRARAAASYLTLEGRSDDGSVTELLLADIRTVLSVDERVASDELCRRLASLDESPWGTWRGRGLEPHGLARLLHHHGVRPRQLWLGRENVRGYRAADFADAFARYLPPLGETARPLGPLGPNPSKGKPSSGPSGLADVPREGGTDLAPLASFDGAGACPSCGRFLEVDDRCRSLPCPCLTDEVPS